MSSRELSLLNLYEIETDGRRRHVVCLLDPVLAGAVGIDSRSVIGEFTPGPEGGFNAETFALNPAFITAFTYYMNAVAAQADEVVESAKGHRSDWLYVLDPRYRPVDDVEPPTRNLLGCFAVDDTGQVVPGSFQYNGNHIWFDSEDGVSGILHDRRFYDWLHRAPDQRGASPSSSNGT